jgi:hypothetical protein
VIHLSFHLRPHCESHAYAALAGSRLGIDWPSLLHLCAGRGALRQSGHSRERIISIA